MNSERDRYKSVEEAALDIIIEGFENIVTRLKELREACSRLPQEAKVGIEATKKIDLAELEKLPWMRFLRNKNDKRVPAGQGEPGWLKNPLYFKDLEAPTLQVELAKAIDKAGGKLKLGGYVFSFGGKENRFINRRPVKRENVTDSSGLKSQGGGLQPGEGQAASPPPEQGGSSR